MDDKGTLMGDGLGTVYEVHQPDSGKSFKITMHNGHLISWSSDRVPNLPDYPMGGKVHDGIAGAIYRWPKGGNPLVLGEGGTP